MTHALRRAVTQDSRAGAGCGDGSERRRRVSKSSPDVRPDPSHATRACATTWALLALAAAVPAARAAIPGDERILARNDLEFARALVRNGYPDLADELLTTIEKGKTQSKDDGLFAQALRLELAEYAAYQLSDALAQSQALEKVVGDMEKFVADHLGTIAADGLNDRLLDLYRGFGERVAAMLANPDTAAEAKSLRGTGEKMFERAIESLKADRETIEKKRGGLETSDPDLDRRYMLASYNLARAYYFHAQILTDEFLKNTRLKHCLQVLGDFQLDFPDELLCFEGYIYEGLAQKDLGQPDEAVIAFDYAIGLRDRFERGANGLYMIGPEDSAAADIVSSAVLQKMILLMSKEDAAGAVEVAKDFFATIPDAGQTLKGLAILSQQADALKKLGDSKGVQAVANRLVELDPRGSGGERGRELLGAASEGALGAVDTYKLAESSFNRGDVERAIEMGQQAMIAARGTAGEADIGSQALLLIGTAFAKKDWMHEAVVAWSSVTQRYGNGKEAPECLWRAANGFLALQAREKGTFYKDGAREAMSEISKRYPQHRYASMAAIIEGQQLEAEEQFEKAADVYMRIPDGSAGHEESLYRAGKAYAGLMSKYLRESKASDAKAAAGKAEDLLKKARTSLEKSAGETLDLAAQERMRALAFSARVALANVYLTRGVDRAADVAPLFENAEREFSGDVAKLSAVRALRLKALQALGQVDQAALLLDQQLKDDPSGKGLGASAAILARAFDERGVGLKATNSVEAEAKLRKAANYYGIAIRGQISGEQAVRVDELEPIASRLYALALQFNGVPDTVVSFVEWKGAKLPDDSLLELAVRAYEAVLTVTPSYRGQIIQARALGFLQRWEDAAESYARLFERESFANLSLRKIDPAALSEKPELAYAFLEWGACERQIGIDKNAPERLSRASSIFETLVLGVRAGSALWWPAKFYQIQTMSDRGVYDGAKIAIRDIERNYPDYDAGPLKERFQRLSKELERK